MNAGDSTLAIAMAGDTVQSHLRCVVILSLAVVHVAPSPHGVWSEAL